MNKQFIFLFLAVTGIFLAGFKKGSLSGDCSKIRNVVDTVGFAHLGWQTDSVMNRINRTYSTELSKVKVNPNTAWRLAICPHDDYTYVGWQYPALLRNIKAKTIIIFGVAHKARQLNISDKIVFDSYSSWQGPYGKIKVSPFRDEIRRTLTKDFCMISDSLQGIEHSVESMLPLLQYYNRDVEIISILVPAMNEVTMSEISDQLASGIAKTLKSHHLEWGKDVALLITTDAVHYGDEDWGGKNMAPYGTDSSGYAKAIKHEHEIIDNCLLGELRPEMTHRLIDYTVQPDNYKEYKWTWCGRYSVPFGLMTAINLQKITGGKPLHGKFIGYSTSIDHKPMPVDDLRMGRTAIATMKHWVGYVSVGYY